MCWSRLTFWQERTWSLKNPLLANFHLKIIKLLWSICYVWRVMYYCAIGNNKEHFRLNTRHAGLSPAARMLDLVRFWRSVASCSKIPRRLIFRSFHPVETRQVLAGPHSSTWILPQQKSPSPSPWTDPRAKYNENHRERIRRIACPCRTDHYQIW